MPCVPLLSMLAASIAGVAVAQAPPGPCQAVFDAMLKETMTPHHAVTVRSGAEAGESIATSDTMYVKVRGVWKKSPMTMHAMLAQQQENIRGATVASCSVLSDDVVNGEAAAVWHAHYEQPDLGVSESKVWVSKATGLPLKTEVSVQAGEKTSVVTTFDYGHITAPVVK